MKKTLMFLAFMLGTFISIQAQSTSGNGGSTPWVVLTEEYDTSPFNDTTNVDVYFDGSSYTGYVTSVQFKVAYDGVTFDSLYTIKSNLSNDYVMSYNEDQDNDEVLISIVYIGSSTTTTIPGGSIVTLKLDNVPVKLLYSNEQNITAFTFAGYTAGGSNSNGTDISVGTFSHGGAVKIPHRKFSGYVLDYGTGKGITNLEYQLYRGNSLMTTVLGGQPTKTSSTGYYELVYYEHYYGAITAQTDFDFLFKTEALDSDAALSTADAYKVLLYANEKIALNAYQRLAADVNHSHTVTIADSYTLYSYNAGAYNNWSNFGAGGYRDVMFIRPENVKYLEGDSTTVTSVGTGPLGFSPQETNWTYDLNAYNGISDLTENFYVVIMGDVNLTSLGGSSPPAKSVPNNQYILDISTSILAQLPDQTVTTGDEFYVDLVLDTDDQDVHSFNFELEYDPEVLQFIEATTPYLPNAWQLYFNTDSTGMVSYGGIDASVGNFPIRTDTVETILQFKFKALEVTGIGETPVEFGTKYNTGNRLGDDFNTIVIDGKVYLHVISPVLEPTDFPKGYELEQNYPNPFNPTTTIGFTVVNPQNISIDVFNIHGQHIQNIFNGMVSTGRHEVIFDAAGLPSGIYLYRLTTRNGIQVKKLTLLK
jgi:hypothetical protein